MITNNISSVSDLLGYSIYSFAENQMCSIQFRSIRDIKELSLSVMINLANCPDISCSSGFDNVGKDCNLSSETKQSLRLAVIPLKSLANNIIQSVLSPQKEIFNKSISNGMFETAASWVQLDDDGLRRLLFESSKKQTVSNSVNDSKSSSNLENCTLNDAISDFVFRYMNKIRFSTINEIKNRSINAIQSVGNIPSENLLEALLKVNKPYTLNNCNNLDFNKAILVLFDLAKSISKSFVVPLIKSSLLKTVSASIVHVCSQWLKFDDDGLRYLLTKSNLSSSVVLDQYASGSVVPVKDYALIKKIEHLGLLACRNINVPIANDTSFLINLVGKDNSVVSKFPHLFLNNKSVVLHIIQELQSKNSEYPYYLFNLLNLSSTLKLDKDIFLSLAKSYRTRHYCVCLDSSLSTDKEFFLILVGICGTLLRHASVQLQDDTDVVLMAIQNDPSAIAFASKSKQECHYVILKFVEFSFKSENFSSVKENEVLQ